MKRLLCLLLGHRRVGYVFEESPRYHGLKVARLHCHDCGKVWRREAWRGEP